MLTRFVPKPVGYKTPLILLLTVIAMSGIAFFVSKSVAFTNPPLTTEEQDAIYDSLPKPPNGSLPPPPELPEDLQNEVSTDPYGNLPPPPPQPPKQEK